MKSFRIRKGKGLYIKSYDLGDFMCEFDYIDEVIALRQIYSDGVVSQSSMVYLKKDWESVIIFMLDREEYEVCDEIIKFKNK